MSHLDIARNIERGFRRAKIPMAYSQGFSPHPKISFGPVLPVGVGSSAEYFDIQLREPLGAEKLKIILNAKLPKILQVTETVVLAEGSASLGKLVKMCAYKLSCSSDKLRPDDLFKLANDKLSLTNQLIIINSKNGKEKKIKIRNLNRAKSNQYLTIDILAEIYARVFDIISEIENLLGVSFDEYDIERTEQYAILHGELIGLADHRIVRSSSGSGG